MPASQFVLSAPPATTGSPRHHKSKFESLGTNYGTDSTALSDREREPDATASLALTFSVSAGTFSLFF